MNVSKNEIGDVFEEKALGYLIEQGYTVLAKKYRYHRGEIDIIVKEPKTEHIIFCEVKYRAQHKKSLQEAYPIEASVPLAKQRNLIACAKGFLEEHPEHQDTMARFDCLLFQKTGSAGSTKQEKLTHIKNAFHE